MRIIEEKIAISQAKNARVTLYLHEDYAEVYGVRKRPMIVICPGGGYNHASVREAEPIAMQFLTAGCHAAVVWYDVAGDEAVFPQQILELATAMTHIREHAEEFHVDPDKMIVAGFSAGGHLAASLGCFWNKEWFQKKMEQQLGVKKELYQPNGLILAYPVISSGKYAHRGSFECLLQDKLTRGCEVTGMSGKELLTYVSLEHQVSKDVPPVFMWHTFEDGTVPVQNSMMFAMALKEADVSLEYHVFPYGGHGYALGTEETATISKKEIDEQVPMWVPLCKKWLDVTYKIYG